jgi:hypothetical protein
MELDSTLYKYISENVSNLIVSNELTCIRYTGLHFYSDDTDDLGVKIISAILQKDESEAKCGQLA